MKTYPVTFQGQVHHIPAVKYQGRLWFHWRGETHVLELGSNRRAASGKSGARPGVIHAPMPGKITRLSVKVGDTVTKEQTLVVLEAMKMEYTIKADQAGKVLEVAVKAGGQVSLGDLLVRVGEQDGAS